MEKFLDYLVSFYSVFLGRIASAVQAQKRALHSVVNVRAVGLLAGLLKQEVVTKFVETEIRSDRRAVNSHLVYRQYCYGCTYFLRVSHVGAARLLRNHFVVIIYIPVQKNLLQFSVVTKEVL